ncbi:Glu-tRNA(Gln) amidotransferase GatDE subunit D [Candidatus Woesearchaeota archaeon]|nr:Glu-tRNA(Gln) amidotransferase GatDE subunit D [Candidatus Woesearchaeota archaeon]|tara:strand:+ start:2809 stop:4092 length:1284 start_codon:yes stop_codon:yes gene_type:complete
MTAKPGDRVKVITKDEIKEGILMPNEETDSIIIKLDNGYNIGIDNKKAKEIKVIEKYKAKETTSKKEIKKDNKKPTISILHTGGTIASKVDYESGGVVASFSDEDFVNMFPEVKKIANIKSILVSNMMSEDMRFFHYKKMSDSIVKAIKDKVDGIIIGHGTDTLALTAAALSFVFENLPIPVILVGSQRSTDRGSTDAGVNLICAAEFIIKTDFIGVGICMHENTSDNSCLILPATKTKKLHTSRRDAFKAVNDKAIARVNYETKKIEFLKKYEKKSKEKLIIRDKFEDKVAIIKSYPNMFPDLIDTLTQKGYKGVVLEGTGIGLMPTNIKENKMNLDAIKKFMDSGGIAVITSNCIFGRVHKDIYSGTRLLKNIGVISGQDMLTETAFIKLAWLLGNFKKEEAKELMTKNLKGEINERLLGDEFLD